MKKIVLTHPTFFYDEPERIIQVLGDKDVMLHIRKPNARLEDYEALIQSLPIRLHCRLVLHDWYVLQEKYDVAGLHFSTAQRLMSACTPTSGSKSTSCHSLGELAALDGQFDYAFLSPIFPSISKPGYQSGLDMDAVESYLHTQLKTQVIALGGIRPEHFDQLETMGFAGAAMLGAVWKLNKKQ